MKFYVGLAATFHDPAMAIVSPEGEILFAEATERYMQSKRAFNCSPVNLVQGPALIRQHCHPDAELAVAVSWSEKTVKSLNRSTMGRLFPFKHLGRLEDYLFAKLDYKFWPFPDIRSMRDSMLSSLTQAPVNLVNSRYVHHPSSVRWLNHHLTHAAMACYTSPFDEALCAVVDGYGEWASVACFRYRGSKITPLQKPPSYLATRTVSLGMFYAMLCECCGFESLSKGEEWKVMGLAPYGKVDPELYDLLRPMVVAKGLEVVAGCSAADYRRRLAKLRSLTRHPESSPLEAADLAHTGQVIFGEVMSDLLRNLYEVGGSDNLVLGGGCALNSAWNGKVLGTTPFQRLHVPSAPGDDGNALGAALLAYFEDHPDRLPSPSYRSPYLGTDISVNKVERLIDFGNLKHMRHLPGEITRHAAELLAQGKIIGWMQGRAEFGPRALGNRSILADPRAPDMKDRINARVKFREGYRPFAPSILHEMGDKYFEDYQESPYMDRALIFREEVREQIPAVVHSDGTGRLQSVRKEMSPKYHQLISDFHDITGVPIVLNTSFNVMGKPIIHSVEDAIAVFFTSGLDALVIDDYLLEKAHAPAALQPDPEVLAPEVHV